MIASTLEIADELGINGAMFADFITNLSDADFEFSPDGKWSAGQNVEHLIKSMSPVNMALRLPKFLPRMLYGRANRASKTFDELVDRYTERLAAGGTATSPFVPSVVLASQKDAKLAAFSNQVARLARVTNTWTEAQLDEYILPHPLLGKVTIREMLFFSVYHIEHHLNILKARKKQ